MSYAIFSVESFVGGLPAFHGKTLYMARVDPHLTSGCEVVLDVDKGLLAPLESVQHRFLRRLLGLKYRSMLAVLFTETGVLPIRYRRIILALGYLKYLIALPPNRFAWSAFMDSVRLARLGHRCWLNDLRAVLALLPNPVVTTIEEMTEAASVEKIIDAVTNSCERSLQRVIDTSPMTGLLRNRVEIDEDGGEPKLTVLYFRHYR
ncbi:hypothetical protein PLICRDRAFT_36739 [Plicaturopsis crispa FD-325 SS-3]|nr:hypothetical protein PLICRDRAFT_36739 [Plicaturopsis crispa FD-325 SS-3]